MDLAFIPEIGIGDLPSWISLLSVPLVALIGYFFSRFRNRNKKIANNFYNKGLLSYNYKQFKDAITKLDIAIKHNPEYIEALTLRCKAYFEIQEYEKALDDYDAIASLNPSVAEELKDIKIKSEGFIKEKLIKNETFQKDKIKTERKDLFLNQILEKAKKLKPFANAARSIPLFEPAIITKKEIGGYKLIYNFGIEEHRGSFHVSIYGTFEAIKELNEIQELIRKDLDAINFFWYYDENASKITIIPPTIIEIGYCDSKSKWPEFQNTMINTMISLENSLNKAINKITIKK